jgi:CheY-like chemotaxis protein
MSKESVLNDKRILAVDDEQDVLDVLKEEIMMAAPSCIVETATTFQQASMLLVAWTYDLAILDIMGVRGLDLLRMAVERPYPVPVVMLTGRALSPEVLKESISRGARAYLPKKHLGAVVPFLEDVLTHEYGPVWRRILTDIEGFFSEGWGPYWRKPDEKFWKEFDEKIAAEGKQ